MSSRTFSQEHGNKFAYMARGLENDTQQWLPVSGAVMREVILLYNSFAELEDEN